MKYSKTMNRASRGVFLLLAAALAAPVSATSQKLPFEVPTLGLAFRGGVFMPTASGSLFNLMRNELTLAAADLRSPAWGVEVSAGILDRLQLMAGWETSSTTSSSEIRNPTIGLGQDQKTTLEMGSNVFAGVRAFLFPHEGGGSVMTGRTVPMNIYLTLGGGTKSFELRHRGWFPDGPSRDSFDADFHSEASTGYGFAGVGAEVALPASLTLMAEFRYQGGSASPDGDFAEFESLDVSGVGFSIGLARYW
jgi:opacity protein-like surface antigen